MASPALRELRDTYSPAAELLIEVLDRAGRADEARPSPAASPNWQLSDTNAQWHTSPGNRNSASLSRALRELEQTVRQRQVWDEKAR